MTAANWGILIPAVVAVLTASAAYLKARTAKKSANSAHNAILGHVTEHTFGESHNDGN